MSQLQRCRSFCCIEEWEALDLYAVSTSEPQLRSFPRPPGSGAVVLKASRRLDKPHSDLTWSETMQAKKSRSGFGRQHLPMHAYLGMSLQQALSHQWRLRRGTKQWHICPHDGIQKDHSNTGKGCLKRSTTNSHLVDVHGHVHDIPDACPPDDPVLFQRAGLYPEEGCHAKQGRPLCHHSADAAVGRQQLRQRSSGVFVLHAVWPDWHFCIGLADVYSK